jgi:hypothetical protein
MYNYDLVTLETDARFFRDTKYREKELQLLSQPPEVQAEFHQKAFFKKRKSTSTDEKNL